MTEPVVREWELLPCPRCGTHAEVVLGNHIRCANIYNCDCETRLGAVAWNRRVEQRAYLLAKCAEVDALKKRAETAEYELKRWKDVDAKRPDWETLWSEQSARAEAAEARCAALRKYVRHIPPCVGVIRPCTCGLDGALAQTEKP